MREIKFRAWDKRVGIYEIARLDMPWPYKDIPIMQFTGLHDTEGKEIFEGDILEHHSGMVKKGTNPYIKRVVKWNKIDACFMGCFSGKVIGNIYENKELLEAPHEG
jgi:uncharacterized phage protein (TIGR01671 family)